jgi:erythromycin esterase
MFFNQGGFKALDVNMPSKGMYNFSVEQAPTGTLEHTFAGAGLPLAIVDMNQLPKGGPIHEWFYTKRPTRHSGAGYNVNRPDDYFWSYIPAEAYDALIFLDTTTPVMSINKADYDVIWMLDKKFDYPMNLDFELGNSGDIPEGWLVWSKFQRLGVQFEVTDENPYQGKNSVMLYRPDSVTFGELTPNLTQTIDATPYRGKKIRMKAAVRSDVQEPGFAFFRLVIEPDVLQSAHDGSPPLFDSLDQFRIASSQWEILQIETEVPEDANTINYGMYLRDYGTVWIDDVEIEIIK